MSQYEKDKESSKKDRRQKDLSNKEIWMMDPFRFLKWGCTNTMVSRVDLNPVAKVFEV